MPQPTTLPKRNKVRKHKDALLNSLSGKERNTLRTLILKFYKDLKNVSHKRGSRNFSVGRWMDSNL